MSYRTRNVQNEGLGTSLHKTWTTKEDVGPRSRIGGREIFDETPPSASSYTEVRKVKTTAPITEHTEPLPPAGPRREIVGQAYTHYLTNNIPIYETVTADGGHLVVSQNASHRGEHPVADILNAIATKDRIHNDHLEGVMSRSIQILERERGSALLDNHGKALAKDLEHLIESINRLIMEKNRDEVLQTLILSSVRSMKEGASLLSGPQAAKTNLGLGDAATTLYNAVRDLTITLLKSGDFRDLSGDILDFSRDLMKAKTKKTQRGIQQPTANVIPSYSIPSERIIKTEYEVKNLGQQPYVERTVIREQPVEYQLPRTYGQQEYQPRPYEQQDYQPPSDLFVQRFVTLLKRLGARPEYQRAVKDLFKIMDAMAERADMLRYDPKAVLPINTSHLMNALRDSRKLLGRFSGEQEMDRFIRHFNTLLQDVRGDAEMKDLFSRLKNFILYAVDHPSNLDEERNMTEARELMNLSNRSMRKPLWNSRFKEILNDLRSMFSNFMRDTQANNFANKLQNFIKDFALNAEGKPDLWVIDNSLTQLKFILVPLLREHFANVPIDRIEMVSPRFDFVVEDIVFSASDILPDRINFKIKNEMEMNLQNIVMDQSVHKLQLTIDHITPILNNVTFYYKMKSGIKMEDHGVVDIAVRGSGMTIHINWRLINPTGLTPKVDLATIRVSLSDLTIHFDRTKHKFLNTIATSLFLNTIKTRIAGAVADMLQTRITLIDDQLNRFFQQRPIIQLKDRADQVLKNVLVKTEVLAAKKETMARKKDYFKAKGKELKREPSIAKSLKDSLKKTLIPEESTAIPPAVQAAPQQASYAPSYVSRPASYVTTPSTSYVPQPTYASQPATSYVSPATSYVPQPTYASQPATSYTGVASTVPQPSGIPTGAIPIYTQEKIIIEDIRTTPEGRPLRFVEQMTKSAV